MLRDRSFLQKAKGKQKPSPQPVPDFTAQDAVSTLPLPQLPAIQDLELDQQHQLPYELFLEIFSYIEDRNDNLNLCRTSKLFRSIVEPLVYKNIDLNFDGYEDNLSRSLQLLEIIQNPRLWNIITAVRVTSQPCLKRSKSTEDHVKKCTCGVIDQRLGTALQSIQTLEVLSISCTLCRNLYTGRHRYLTNLGTRRMRHFDYECRCSMGNSFDLPTLFTAPWIQSLNSLCWLTNIWTTIPSEQLEKLLKNPNFLPQLNTLHYSGHGMFEKLLTGRKITRLSGGIDVMTQIGAHINKSSITHLSIHTSFLSRILDIPGVLKQFHNLQHIGTITFAYPEGSGHKMAGLLPLSFSIK
ncbi:hypothetical protein M408DRAFT_30686 [Serendipita vermifera MAFF 305830]|uniref:F-box domain-containing protein n=1 Tax=Serendipita vermifera MAFF 305830 TaxID=933852 RepID=A0A0C3AL92_SERVB|nr:hypothetical protein M408DRAFT_30686 [Serendipita vermifera MAFF 305830]